MMHGITQNCNHTIRSFPIRRYLFSRQCSHGSIPCITYKCIHNIYSFFWYYPLSCFNIQWYPFFLIIYSYHPNSWLYIVYCSNFSYEIIRSWNTTSNFNDIFRLPCIFIHFLYNLLKLWNFSKNKCCTIVFWHPYFFYIFRKIKTWTYFSSHESFLISRT